MHVTIRSLVAFLAILTTVQRGWAGCDPSADPDRSEVANARAAVAAACDCNGDRRTYLRCASQTAEATLVNESCTRVVRRCASHSICGRPGSVTCCRTSQSGRVSCSVKRDATRCRPPAGGSACVGAAASCCDACGSGTCTPTTTTSTTATTSTSTSSTQPPPACGPTGPGSCGGACFDPSDSCELDTQTGACVCVPGPCHPFGGIGSCRGTCSNGGTCSLCAACGGCGCIIGCIGGTFPQCDGTCPPGYVCGSDGVDPGCLCVAAP